MSNPKEIKEQLETEKRKQLRSKRKYIEQKKTVDRIVKEQGAKLQQQIKEDENTKS